MQGLYQWKTSKTVLLFNKDNFHDIDYHQSICLLPVVYKLFTRVILNKSGKILDEESHMSKQGFEKDTMNIIRMTQDSSKYYEITRECSI
ncbi:unnamed protein product [Angiostrongylus costaricensis]|uniref:Uncharacterized protein n=1 Tax=Angiostrongylus costaricensis TaxID=334426 RepID=A0A0R3PK21_ANGCS|nr:unnamed protein product [Angiostrongylus costaricensis]